MAYNDNKVVLEDVQITLRNFAGVEGQYNQEGERGFAVLLDPETAQLMQDDGWNVKWFKVREEGDVPQAFLSIAVSYKNRPPRVVMITSKGRTTLSEDELELLDWADIRTVDMILNPYTWAVNKKTGIKAYLRSMFVTIEEDELERKYSDLENAR